MIRITILFVSILIFISMIVLAINSLSPQEGEKFNISKWNLGNGFNIEYYEKVIGKALFTSDYDKILSIKTGSYEDTYIIGNVGGRLQNLELLKCKNNNIVYLTSDRSSKKSSYEIIAILDIDNKLFLDRNRLTWNESELSTMEKKLKDFIFLSTCGAESITESSRQRGTAMGGQSLSGDK